MEMVSVLNRIVSEDFNEKVTVFVRVLQETESRNVQICSEQSRLPSVTLTGLVQSVGSMKRTKFCFQTVLEPKTDCDINSCYDSQTAGLPCSFQT